MRKVSYKKRAPRKRYLTLAKRADLLEVREIRAANIMLGTMILALATISLVTVIMIYAPTVFYHIFAGGK